MSSYHLVVTMFKAYCDTTCLILLLVPPCSQSVQSSQKPICSLTIECPNKSQVCIRSECVQLATSNDVWMVAYGAIATILLVTFRDMAKCLKQTQKFSFW